MMSGDPFTLPVSRSMTVTITNIPSCASTWRSRKTTSPISPTPKPSTITYEAGTFSFSRIIWRGFTVTTWPFSAITILLSGIPTERAKIGIGDQHRILAVDRHKEFGPHNAHHFHQFFLFGMAAGMNIHHFIMVDFDALAQNFVFQVLYRAFVARNHRRRKDHRIAFFEAQKAMFAIDDFHQYRVGFALGAGADHG